MSGGSFLFGLPAYPFPPHRTSDGTKFLPASFDVWGRAG
jgi:hypothetical protein